MSSRDPSRAFSWIKVRADGIDIVVRLTPRAAKDAVDGLAAASDGCPHLAARVRAVPEKGAANKALERLLADVLGLPASAITVVSGSTSRLKTVRLSGDPGGLSTKLQALAPPSPARDAPEALGSRGKAH